MTNEQIKKLVLNYADMLKEKGFPVGNIIDVKLSWGRKTLGLCQMTNKGNYIIRISKYSDVDTMEGTIFHEIIHTFPGCLNHGEGFKQYASIINRLYDMNIDTHSRMPKIRTNVTLICSCCKKVLYQYKELNNLQVLELRKKLKSYQSKCCHKDIKLIFDWQQNSIVLLYK